MQKLRNLISPQLFIFVIVPTLLVAFYYFAYAADIYVARAKIGLETDKGMALPQGEGVMNQILSGAGEQKQIYMVKAFIESPTLVRRLVKRHNLEKIFRHPDADFYKRLKDNATREDIHDYYRDMVKVHYNPDAQILEVTSRAFEPEQAHKLNKAIIRETETFVNKMTGRMQSDSVAFARKKVREAENKLLEINAKLMHFRNENRNFDPTKETGGIFEIMQTLKGERAKKRAELKAARKFYSKQSSKIKTLETEIEAINSQIEELNSRITRKGGAPLTGLLEDYKKLEAKQGFARKRYEKALTAYETAQIKAQKKSKYLISIVEPTKPESAQEPDRIYNIFMVLVVLLIGYGIIRLIFDAVRDNML